MPLNKQNMFHSFSTHQGIHPHSTPLVLQPETYLKKPLQLQWHWVFPVELCFIMLLWTSITFSSAAHKLCLHQQPSQRRHHSCLSRQIVYWPLCNHTRKWCHLHTPSRQHPCLDQGSHGCGKGRHSSGRGGGTSTETGNRKESKIPSLQGFTQEFLLYPSQTADGD